MTVAEICQVLVGPKFKVQPSELPLLTITFIRDVLFVERDENGNPDIGGSLTYEEQFRRDWAKKGGTPEQVERLWRGHWELQARGAPEGEWKSYVDHVLGNDWVERWRRRSKSK